MLNRLAAACLLALLAGCGSSSASSTSGSGGATAGSSSSGSTSSGSTGTASSSGSSGASTGSTGQQGSSGTTGAGGDATILYSDGNSWANTSALIWRDQQPFDPSDVEVVLGDSSACGFSASQESGSTFFDATFVRLHVSYGDGGPVQAGVYALDGAGTLASYFSYANNGGNGGGGNLVYATGTITLSSVDGGGIAGSFDVYEEDGGAHLFAGTDHLSGSFDAAPCP